MVSFATDIPSILASIEKNQNSILAIIANIGKIVTAMDKIGWDPGDTKKVRKFTVGALNNLTEICEAFMIYGKAAEATVPHIKFAAKHTTFIIKNILKIAKETMKLLKATEKISFGGIYLAVDKIFFLVYRIVERSADLAEFLMTGKRPGFHLFKRKISLKNMYVGLASFTILAKILGSIFTNLTPLIQNIILMGKNTISVNKGLKSFQIILFGGGRFIKKLPGIFSIIAKIAEMGVGNFVRMRIGLVFLASIVETLATKVVTPLETLTTFLKSFGKSPMQTINGLKLFKVLLWGDKNPGKLPGLFNILSGSFSKESQDIKPQDIANAALKIASMAMSAVSAAGLLVLTSKLIMPPALVIAVNLAELAEASSFKKGLKLFKVLLWGGKDPSKLPGLFNILSGSFSAESKDINQQDIINSALKIASMTMTAMSAAVLLNFTALLIMPPLATIIEKLAMLGKNSSLVKKGLLTMTLMLFSGTTGKFFWKKKYPGLFEILADINMDKIKMPELLYATKVLMIVGYGIAPALYVVTSVLAYIGSVKKRRMRKAFKIIRICMDGIRSIIVDYFSSDDFMKNVASSLKVLLLLDIFTIMLGFCIAGFAWIGVFGLLAVLGIGAAILCVMGIRAIVFQLSKISMKKAAYASALMFILAPVLIGEVGLMALIGILSVMNLEVNIFKKVVLFVGASTLLLVGMVGMIWILNKIRFKNLVTATGLLKMIIEGILIGFGTKGLVWMLQQIVTLGAVKNTIKKVILFLVSSYLLLGGMIGIIWLIDRLKFKDAAKANTLLKLIVEGILVGAGAKGLIWLLQEIIKTNPTKQTVKKVILFLMGAYLLVGGMYFLVFILSKLPLAKTLVAIATLTAMVGSLMLLAQTILSIQEAIDKIKIGALLGFAGILIAFVVLFALMGYILPALGAAIISVLLFAVLITGVLLIALELKLLAMIDVSELETAKENAKIVFETCVGIIRAFMEAAVPEAENAPNGFVKFLMYVGGPLAVIAEALASMVFVIIAFVTVTMVLLLAGELYLLAQLDMQSISKDVHINIGIVFGCVWLIFTLLNAQMESTNSHNDKGVIGAIISFFSPQLNAMIDAIFMFAFAALAVLTIGMVLIIAVELRMIQELDLNQETISNNIKIVFDSVNQIIAAVLAPPEKEGEPMEEGALGWLIRHVYPPLANILNAIFTFAYVALALLTVAGVMLIAMSLKKIQDIKLEPEKIRTNLDAIFTSVNAVHAAIMVRRNLKDEGEDKSWFKDLISNLPGLGTISKIADAISEMGTVATSMIIVGSIASIAESLKKIETISLNAKTVQVNTQNIMNCVDLVWKKLKQWKLGEEDEDLFENMEGLMNGVSKLADASIKFSKVDPTKHASATNDIIKLIDKTKTIDVNKLNTVTLMFKQLAEFSKSIKGNFDKLADVLNDKLIDILERLHVALKEIQESEKTVSTGPVDNAPTTSSGSGSIVEKARTAAARTTGVAAGKGTANTPGGKVDLSEIQNELKAITRVLKSTLSVSVSPTSSSTI